MEEVVGSIPTRSTIFTRLGSITSRAFARRVQPIIKRGLFYFLQVGIVLALGIPITIVSGRVLASKLFGVISHDPMVLVITTMVLLIAAFVAAVIPARRAAKTEPMLALRTE